jgi:hypothetical protein
MLTSGLNEASHGYVPSMSIPSAGAASGISSRHSPISDEGATASRHSVHLANGQLVSSPYSLLAKATTEAAARKNARDLAAVTMAALREFFEANTNHRPSEAMYAALENAALCMAECAFFLRQRAVFVSSLAPGVGKTQLVIEFLRALRSRRFWDVAVLVCVARLDEIDSYVSRLNLSPREFSVLTSDPTRNASGYPNPWSAQILFTTQQMINARCEGGTFENIEAFHYTGRPRQVRIWDESILPGRPLTLGRDDLAFLFRPL